MSQLLQVIVFGRSLGGAVSFGLAAANPGSINSLIVENTFWSIEAVAGKVSRQYMPCICLITVANVLGSRASTQNS